MANFHSDKWIMSKVQEHYDELCTMYPQNRIIGVFLQGSQNYLLDTEFSDIDTKAILIPSWEDVCFNYKPISTTHIRDNEEHIDLKDVRLYFQTFRKQNLNFMEILFTKYKIINPKYAEEWKILERHAEDIARYDPVGAVKTMKGIAMEKWHAMEHRYPSKIEIIDKFGYDPKQLHHLLRVEEYIQRYINEELYCECLMSQKAEYLKDVKSPVNPKYSLETARRVGQDALDHILEIYDNYVKTHEQIIDEDVDDLLNMVQEKLMRKSITHSLNAVCPECGTMLEEVCTWDNPMYECPNCISAYEEIDGKFKKYYFG